MTILTNSENNILQKNEKKSKPSWKFFALIIACVVIIAAIGIFAFIQTTKVDQSAYSIGYTVKAVPEGSLNVDISIDVSKLSQDRTIPLYKGLMGEDSVEFIECLDDSGREVTLAETPDLVSIGPIEGGVESVRLNYNVLIGELDQSYELDVIPYTKGCVLDDLIVFSGEYALLIPFLDPDSFDDMGKYVANVNFEFIVPQGLVPIVPYQRPIEGQLAFSKDKPDWEFFNTISKSAFCFGQFEKYDYNGFFEDSSIFVDKQVMSELSQYPLDALAVFLDYYRVVFGEPLGEVPVVLLRNHPVDNSVITGGAGSACSAISINLRVAEDFRAMSNMVFHTFFDSKIKSPNLRYMNYNWIYRGLADYYVGLSSGSLPSYVVDEYSIGGAMHPAQRYLRYLYFSLKEPGFLAVSPAAEETGMYIAQEEFYMGVKVPLIIDAINHSIGGNSGEPDGFIKALASKGKAAKPLDVEKLLKEYCGADYDAITDYLSGKALVPNYLGLDLNEDSYTVDLSRNSIIYMLDQDEQRYAYFFSLEYVYYPYTYMFLLNEEEFMAEAAKRGIHYNSDIIQNEVKKFSSVLHRLLLQYAMWASLAGIDDVTIPNIKGAMTEDDVMAEWRELCGQIGYEYRIED
jgi:hypothetical protein